MLQLQLEILREPDTNPFECTSSDVEKACSKYLYSLDVLQLHANCEIENHIKNIFLDKC